MTDDLHNFLGTDRALQVDLNARGGWVCPAATDN